MFVEHPESKIKIRGERLATGTIINEGDMYASSDGSWQKCPSVMVGHSSRGHVVWVRPENNPPVISEHPRIEQRA